MTRAGSWITLVLLVLLVVVTVLAGPTTPASAQRVFTVTPFRPPPLPPTPIPSPRPTQPPVAPTVPPPTAAPTSAPAVPTEPPPPPPEKEKSPTPWPTATETRVPTATPTATASLTATSTQTSTATPTATATSTNTASPTTTATATSSPTVTASPVPPTVAMPTFTPTPTVTPTPWAVSLHLNEIMASPRSVDWNGDGTANAGDGWIELYNASQVTVDLGGWQLSAPGRTSVVLAVMPPGTSIGPRGYLNRYVSQTGLALDAAGGEVRLLYPNGAVADSVRYPALAADQTAARSVDGGGQWVTNCRPTPGALNCLALVTATSGFNLPYFREHILTPTRVAGLNLGVLATNLLLALILALAMGFFGNLVNDALESHEEHLKRLLAPLHAITALFQRTITRLNPLGRLSTSLGWLGLPISLGVIILIYGVVLAFLDPTFSITDKDAWLLVLALALATGTVALCDDLAQYIYLRRRGAQGAMRVHGGNLILVLTTTLFSRAFGFSPGILAGSPAGIEEVDDPAFELPSHWLALGTLALVAFAAWVTTSVFAVDAWWETLSLLVFAAGVQTLFFEMLPLRYLHGRAIFETSRITWLVLFATITAVFMQTMLNPDGAFIAAFEVPDMVVLSLTVVAFCIASTLLWFYLQNLDKAQTARAAE